MKSRHNSERVTRMCVGEDNRRRVSAQEDFVLVTGNDWRLESTIRCLTIQFENTWMWVAAPEKRIDKRLLKWKGKFTPSLLKAEEQDKKNLDFFLDLREKIRLKLIEVKETLRARPELERQKLVAFAMGYHKRLGADSLVTTLDINLVQMMIEQV
jgi:hypothetical protein